ncbi:MAG: hypothetical protein HQ555_03490 [Candidatus Aminicenantes bacterium]|nr:hypothetical protein [Candidatus Aminicenantes bacterium]
MKNLLRVKVLISFIIAFLLIFPTITHAQKQKIKVMVRDASIRIQPNIDSEIILTPLVGSIFEVEKKIGEWYEIKFSSETGVLITGYIHELFVEVESEIVRPRQEIIPEPVKTEPEYQPQEEARPRGQSRVSLKGGGIFTLIPELYSFDYSFPYRGETFYMWDSVDKNNAFGYEVGLGIYPIPYIEFEGTVTIFSKELTGYYGIDLPSEYYFALSASDEVEAYPTFQKTTFCFGLLIHPVVTGSIRLYFGGGGSYVMGNLEMVDDIISSEIDEQLIPLHEVTITEVQFVETNDLEDVNLSKFGFYGKTGIDFMASENIALYIEGKYVFAKVKEVPYYMLSDLDPTAIIEEIDLGGIFFSIGLKLIF